MGLGIDKKSSAELSEAINSMFKWYRHSVECYVLESTLHTTRLRDILSRTTAFPQYVWSIY